MYVCIDCPCEYFQETSCANQEKWKWFSPEVPDVLRVEITPFTEQVLH